VRPRRLPRSFPNNRRSNGETRSPGTPSASTRGRCSGSARELESDSQSVGKSSSVMTVISNWSQPPAMALRSSFRSRLRMAPRPDPTADLAAVSPLSSTPRLRGCPSRLRR
jgi:hypothetical protein